MLISRCGVMKTHWVLQPSHVNWVKELSESSAKGFQREHYGILNLTKPLCQQYNSFPTHRLIRLSNAIRPEDERSFPQVQSQEVQAPVSPLLAIQCHLQSHVRLMTIIQLTRLTRLKHSQLWWDREMGLQLKVLHGHKVPNELDTPRSPQHLQSPVCLGMSRLLGPLWCQLNPNVVHSTIKLSQ